MTKLLDLISVESNTGMIMYATSVSIPLAPVKIRLVSPKEIMNLDNNRVLNLYAVIVDETGNIPVPSKFRTIPTHNVLVFNSLKEAEDEYKTKWVLQ